jgi:TonB family protein
VKRVAFGLAVVLLQASRCLAQDVPLHAGRDVARPKRVHDESPIYPPSARQAGVQGLIVMEVTLNEKGGPVDIRVLRSIPILEQAATDAVREWRYEPTIVNGVPRRVVLVEAVDFFNSDGEMERAYSNIAASTREPVGFRLYAIARLRELPPKHYKSVSRVLERLAKDSDITIAEAAGQALGSLASPRK